MRNISFFCKAYKLLILQNAQYFIEGARMVKKWEQKHLYAKIIQFLK
jgi:hypothetical protein